MSSPHVLSVVFCLLTCSGLTHGLDHGVRMVVEDGSDVILPCSLSNKQDITAAAFHWKKEAQKDQRQKEVFFYDAATHYNNGHDGQSEEFKGRVSHFEDQLNHGNASIIIRNTKMADSGNYICVFPQLQPRQTFYIELVVGAAPQPYIWTLHDTKYWSLLQCEVRLAFPKPEVEWQDGAGNKLPAEEPQVSKRGGSYDITLKSTVNKTDLYHCVVEQEDIKHRVTSNVSVHISEKVVEDSSTKVAIGWLALVFVLGVFSDQALLVLRNWITKRHKNSRCRQENGSDDEETGPIQMKNGSVHLEMVSCEDPSVLLPQSTEAS
ncbi:V-set domain-containing T-cell activation inhibitor 1-like isoform X2 [Cebidichthys violaceus]|uniref:V-set domain-containing T-cell activation inhibitor 1-like isoform X2 n=1 Tax=Cebidichthys violaceus TaxID=271503 RepID=UPI0035CAD29C